MHQDPKRWRAGAMALNALWAVLAAGGCASLGGLSLPVGADAIKPPTITFRNAILVQAPTQKQLHAYECPDVLQGKLNVPMGAGLVCRGFFGPRPSLAEMSVAFDLRFRVDNPNRIPIPLADVLAAVAVFPQKGNQRLGAVCMHLCPEGDASCVPTPASGACESSSKDVRSFSDFPAVAANLLTSVGVAAATGQPLSLKAPQVAAGATIDVVVRFSFGPEPLLATMKELAAQSLNELQTGREISFDIPYRLEGTVWFDAGSVGRLAVPFGPAEGVWVFPTQPLTAR